MIIDTHQHFWEPGATRAKGPEDYKMLAKEEGVTGTILLADKEFALKLAAVEPLIVGVVGRIDSNEPEFKAEVDKWAMNPLFRGIRRLGREFEDIEKGSFLSDMEYLAVKDLVLDVYRICGGDEAVTKVFSNGPRSLSGYFGNQRSLAGLEKLAERVPQLRIVVSHIGHCPIDGKPLNQTWQDNFRRMAVHSNIYMKVSGLMERFVITEYEKAPEMLSYYRPTLDILWELFGEDRLIYGSNWPVCEHAGDFIASGLHIVRPCFAEKGEEAYTKFFWGNSKAVYKWIPRLPSQR
ncbi:amidohydrolase family protein [Chloroflexota bacterium]